MLTSCENEYYKVVIYTIIYYAEMLISNCDLDTSIGNLSWLFSQEINTNGGILDFYWAGKF